MKILIIGANGKIGKLLIKQLAKSNHEIRAMIRKEEQRPVLEALGAEVVLGDLEGEFEHALEDCDAVVFTAGSGPSTGADKTILIDMWGAMKTMYACTDKGLKRYIMVSSRNAGDPDNGPAKIRHYNVAKHIADEYLKGSKLEYTILRPGKLTDDEGTGHITTTRPDSDQQSITRDDVASCIVYCLDNPGTIGKIVELYQGDTLISEALK
ncbi:MAG TPA: SDR family oxidoreductase [Gammaproteobacteria bacterium]|nr:SDR family oxidoreductase [Gammaproteobacteria bacterium]